MTNIIEGARNIVNRAVDEVYNHAVNGYKGKYPNDVNGLERRDGLIKGAVAAGGVILTPKETIKILFPPKNDPPKLDLKVIIRDIERLTIEGSVFVVPTFPIVSKDDVSILNGLNESREIGKPLVLHDLHLTNGELVYMSIDGEEEALDTVLGVNQELIKYSSELPNWIATLRSAQEQSMPDGQATFNLSLLIQKDDEEDRIVKITPYIEIATDSQDFFVGEQIIKPGALISVSGEVNPKNFHIINPSEPESEMTAVIVDDRYHQEMSDFFAQNFPDVSMVPTGSVIFVEQSRDKRETIQIITDNAALFLTRYGITNNGSKVNLRQGPGTDTADVGDFFNGTTVMLIKPTDDIYYDLQVDLIAQEISDPIIIDPQTERVTMDRNGYKWVAVYGLDTDGTVQTVNREKFAWVAAGVLNNSESSKVEAGPPTPVPPEVMRNMREVDGVLVPKGVDGIVMGGKWYSEADLDRDKNLEIIGPITYVFRDENISTLTLDNTLVADSTEIYLLPYGKIFHNSSDSNVDEVKKLLKLMMAWTMNNAPRSDTFEGSQVNPLLGDKAIVRSMIDGQSRQYNEDNVMRLLSSSNHPQIFVKSIDVDKSLQAGSVQEKRVVELDLGDVRNFRIKFIPYSEMRRKTFESEILPDEGMHSGGIFHVDGETLVLNVFLPKEKSSNKPMVLTPGNTRGYPIIPLLKALEYAIMPELQYSQGAINGRTNDFAIINLAYDEVRKWNIILFDFRDYIGFENVGQGSVNWTPGVKIPFAAF